jgi:hypothetical protein
MRRESLQFLVAGLFLFHVVTECGSHHGHPTEVGLPSAGGCPGSFSAHTSSSAPCGHQHGSGHGNCQQSHCVFVRSKTRSESEPERAVANSFAAADRARLVAPHNRGELRLASSRHVRLHLQLQVLLV